ncbi:hypothetical protein BCR33DRAFT_501784 [Rhizoclosmatium globosum]|uniref:Uncharacterized protein n=1 Tax=Rhizoclosmatium globosum TaxID=329046 RepID=A0A1Y2CVK7_9FUNG|nr:hypothetical protein BCR33DRAFT_501784 [Rhizoclosmatium globosum]|eukprot:ORY51052.1 hypothetical protein BCR33DRAFT_501784 [Rhizoclosmatium globosum]
MWILLLILTPHSTLPSRTIQPFPTSCALIIQIQKTLIQLLKASLHPIKYLKTIMTPSNLLSRPPASDTTDENQILGIQYPRHSRNWIVWESLLIRLKTTKKGRARVNVAKPDTCHNSIICDCISAIPRYPKTQFSNRLTASSFVCKASSFSLLEETRASTIIPNH